MAKVGTAADMDKLLKEQQDKAATRQAQKRRSDLVFNCLQVAVLTLLLIDSIFWTNFEGWLKYGIPLVVGLLLAFQVFRLRNLVNRTRNDTKQ